MAVRLLEVLVVGVEGPDVEPSAEPSVLIIWMEGSVVLTIVKLASVLGLQVLSIGEHGARSSCCFMGDVASTGRTTPEPGEVRGCGEAALVTTATVTVWLGTNESVSLGSCAPAASASLMSMATVATILSEAKRVSFTSKQVAVAAMVSMVTSRVRGAASLGVEAWLVSVS